MKTLVIYAHPWDGSFNNFVKDKVSSLLEANNKTVDIIDLNKDGFNPVLEQADLKEFQRGRFNDKLALSYVNKLKEADELVFIFPIWWYGEPAILKGFYDKVLLKGHVYEQIDNKIQGTLKIDNATIITTAAIDKEFFESVGDPINNVLANSILKTIGVKKSSWIHCETVHLEESRINFLNKLDQHFN